MVYAFLFSDRGLPFTYDVDITDGVARWTTNGQCPFRDMTERMRAAGLPVDVEKTEAARAVDTDRFLEDYRRTMDRPATTEEVFELRAAFGPGRVVVNIITGRETYTGD